MSFAHEVKEEVARYDFGSQNEMIVELNAMIKMNGALTIGNGDINCTIEIDHATTAKRTFSLLKELFDDIIINLSVKKRMKLMKRNTYIISIPNAKSYIDQLGVGFTFNKKFLQEILTGDSDVAKAYIRSLFLSCGSINSPETSNYHLELALNDEQHAKYVVGILNHKDYRLNSKIIVRRKKYVVYIKKSASIADFLKLIGAIDTLMQFEDVRISRDYLNSIHRASNMDVANQMRTNKAAGEMIAIIEFIDNEYGLEYLDESLQKVAQIRLQFPEESMSDLVEIHIEEFGGKISKSGINHKFRKLREIYGNLKGGE